MSKFYLTTPIYYVNDKPHLGSAYTTIAADVLARLHRQRGDDVLFLTGTAEHGSKIAESAVKAGKEPQQFVDENAAKFSLAWDVLNITYDDFIRTTEPRHVKNVIAFFSKLKNSGKVYEGDYEGLYCTGCEAFKKENELVNGLCPLHNRQPELIKERNWFFKLSDYEKTLRELIERDEIKVRPLERKNEVLAFIDQGLEDITISRHTAKFAIPLSWDSAQTIYVWLDELFNYCSAVGYADDRTKFDRWWPADLHLVGKDIIKFHCVFWPALLLAIGEKPPKTIFAHGFFTFNGQKISKTLGNVIDPVEWAQKYGPDAVRYFLLREMPFGADGDVSEQKLKDRYNGDLANNLGNLVSRLAKLVETKLNGELISEAKFIESAITARIEQTKAAVEKGLAEFKLHEALGTIWELFTFANGYIDQGKPWAETDPEKLLQTLTGSVTLLTAGAQLLWPFLPATAEKISATFGQTIQEPSNIYRITKIESLFPRL